ncbi:MAG TPA: DUF4276 family protein [Terriglobia bacterium]
MSVYVEGGGDYKHTDTATACRRGFRELFEKLGIPARRLSIIACGSRSEAFKDFQRRLRRRTDEFVILLVDSEGPVGAQTSWAYLKAKDNWRRPTGTDDQAHLMVQCMQAWFLADREALGEFYGQGFLAGSLCRVTRTLKTRRRGISWPVCRGRREKLRKAPMTRQGMGSNCWRASTR